MATIQLKRGLKVNLPTLAAGEIAFTTDEKLVYVGDGAKNYCVGTVASGIGDPSGNLVAGRLHVNTTTHAIFFCDGSTWAKVGGDSLSDLSGTLDDISDGTNFQKVAASEVDSSGRVTQIADGTNTVTASDARTHINDNTKHRQINDAATSTTGLWSSQHTSDQIGTLMRGVDWQDSVMDKDTLSPPGSPADGNRYLIGGTSAGGWAGHDNQITQYITASGAWVYSALSEGQATWVEDENVLYVYNGSAWVKMSSIYAHNDLSGLQGGTTAEYYHLANADYSALVTNRTETVQDIVGSFVSGAGGATVTYDDAANTLTVSGNLASVKPGTVSSSTSGLIGSSLNAARQDHNHDLGTHGHTGATDGGQVSHGSLGSIAGSADGYHLASADYTALTTNRTETVQDIVGAFIQGAGSIQVNYDDAANTITVSGSGASYSHPLVGGDHTAAGLTIGWVVRATGATTYAWGALQTGDIPATATPGASVIPLSTAGSDLNGWITSLDGGVF
jgi:hypothetical protein